jgi:N6-L-threonylcarbamoyladenine synthase
MVQRLKEFPQETVPVHQWLLGLESSCDETAAAIVDETGLIAASEIASQVAVHKDFGGVVPEIASRHHLLNVIPVIDAALACSALKMEQISGIAVTAGPGLVGALLVGVQFSKALSWVTDKPLWSVNHLLAHLEAVFLRYRQVEQVAPPNFPHIALLVSGGHTILGIRSSPYSLKILGSTRDDAAGEAFDKFSKLIGLGYPGGRVVDDLAAKGNSSAFRFPRAMHGQESWDFSFSGLKTAAKQHVEVNGLPSSNEEKCDLCASFQAAIVDVLDSRVRKAVRVTGIKEVVVAGGVASNSGVRLALQKAGEELGFRLIAPPADLCTDNAAMVAMAGHRKRILCQNAGLDLNVQSTWSIKHMQ